MSTEERNDGPEFVRDVVVLVETLVATVRHTLVYCLPVDGVDTKQSKIWKIRLPCKELYVRVIEPYFML